ncbi:helix-turn-helix domain-containing protein [uncultured Arthrobacter sp.]|uniref:helix-turn-helix domain-containing protein n=1 Tax=uncultured Arthrobacter sp. TaxID=114050 RepID=UPI0026087972|nr:helix-turn-helix domain-containing protein [uncultured Arthrobacter sp.]
MQTSSKSKRRSAEPTTVAQWMESRRPSFSEGDLVVALRRMERPTATVGLSSQDKSFWEQHSGIANSGTSALPSVENVVAQVQLEADALTAEEVAKRLKVDASTVRHYRRENKLHAVTIGGKLRFPLWQFTGQAALPSIGRVLTVLPEDMHPQSVAGFFTTPQPDLVLNGAAVSPREWLLGGGLVDHVVDLAEDLAAGH